MRGATSGGAPLSRRAASRPVPAPCEPGALGPLLAEGSAGGPVGGCRPAGLGSHPTCTRLPRGQSGEGSLPCPRHRPVARKPWGSAPVVAPPSGGDPGFTADPGHPRLPELGVPCLSCDTHQGRGKWMSLRCAYNCNIPLLSQITKQTRGEGDPWECGLGYGAPEEWRWGSMPMTAHRSQGSGCPGLRPLALLPTGWLPAAPGAHTGQSEGRGAGSQCRLSTVMKLRAPVCAEGPSEMGW